MPSPDTSEVSKTSSYKRELIVTSIKEIGALLGCGIWAFVSTLALLLILGCAWGIACAAIIPEAWWWRVLVAILVLAIFAVEGWFLGLKRALAATIVAAIRRFQVASRTLGLLFAAMERLVGERALAKVERLPLRQAEELLHLAMTPLAATVESGGWFRRTIVGYVHRRLVRKVAQMTLAEFRRADAQHPGIELDLVRQRLSQTIDRHLADHLLGSVRKLTWLVVAVTALSVFAAAVTIRLYLLSR